MFLCLYASIVAVIEVLRMVMLKANSVTNVRIVARRIEKAMNERNIPTSSV